ncbi:UNVERIFIED_CONTAM: hypothetical protein NCL1_31626 [Trichonephila clavipes]
MSANKYPVKYTPELLKQLALEVIDGIPLDAVKFYTDGTDPPSNIYRIGHLSETAPAGVFYTFFNSSDRFSILLQWVPSHVGLRGNEVADNVAKAATCDPVDLEDHMVLTSTEIYSRAKELICRTWVVPPVHPWYFQRRPGSAISFKGFSSYQKAFSRSSTGLLRYMNFEEGKRSFPICTKCNISLSQSFLSSAHSANSGVFL